MNKAEAYSQWANRAPEERFWTLDEMQQSLTDRRDSCYTGVIKANQLVVLPSDGGSRLIVKGANGHEAGLNNWSFRQLCSCAGAPASYLQTLPTTTTAGLLTYGLHNHRDEGQVRLLVHRERSQVFPNLADPSGDTDGILVHGGGQDTIQAVTSEKYGRLWNCDLVDRLKGLPDSWRTAPARPANGDPRARPATEDDVLPGNGGFLSIKVGDMIAPAGLYASDEDMFIFMVDEDHRIVDGTDEGLARGFFLSNSEVGKLRFKLSLFLYRHVCGNHIVWGAQDVCELSMRHIGQMEAKVFPKLARELGRYSNSLPGAEENMIRGAQQYQIAPTTEKVEELLFSKGLLTKTFSKAVVQSAVENTDTDGDPRSAWAVANGITRLSQGAEWTDNRTGLDTVAGRVLALAG